MPDGPKPEAWKAESTARVKFLEGAASSLSVARGLWKRCKLSQRGPGCSPGLHKIFLHSTRVEAPYCLTCNSFEQLLKAFINTRPRHQGEAHGGRAPAKIVRAPAKITGLTMFHLGLPNKNFGILGHFWYLKKRKRPRVSSFVIRFQCLMVIFR